MPNLTPKQEDFCIEYILANKNASEAARRAGYSNENGRAGEQGYENLKKPEIIARIAQIQEESGVDSGASLEWAIANLVGVVERSMQREPVVDSEGIVYEYKYDSRGVVSALKLIGEMKGWLEKKAPQQATESKTDQHSIKIQYDFLQNVMSMGVTEPDGGHSARIKYIREMTHNGKLMFTEGDVLSLESLNQ